MRCLRINRSTRTFLSSVSMLFQSTKIAWMTHTVTHKAQSANNAWTRPIIWKQECADAEAIAYFKSFPEFPPPIIWKQECADAERQG